MTACAAITQCISHGMDLEQLLKRLPEMISIVSGLGLFGWNGIFPFPSSG
jgi:hypothetical protein